MLSLAIRVALAMLLCLVVAAIFVESTMTAAKFNDQRVAMLRRKEHARVAKKLEQLVGKFSRKGDKTHHE